ncbi:PQQ-dependent sugar dehydrogenase [Naumannella halotolerans]|uniref:Glucose/arabinose dehydrogenase n=1 Tax=Naumannella halotolerans TaxID=993414 RepID=A0A4R7J7N9_9ACTN|nr:PQQ-dependent sugar dehydrogenase [Naumannella halotolerans]TDT33470.1 glucose/arabinose dehydrogenase [Naumannella halotolerans]
MALLRGTRLSGLGQRLGVVLAVGALGACSAAGEPDTAPTPQTDDTTSAAPATSAASPTSASPSAEAEPDPQTPTDLTTGLTSPWGITERDGVLVMTERDNGTIISIDGESKTELATVDDVDTSSSEGGLLGVEISPAADALFVYYTAGSDNRVAKYPYSDGEITGDPEVILDQIPAGNTHNGGQLRFGPDGYLYVSTGDGGDTSNAQDTESLGGKILRITADGDPAPDNPFDNEVYSYGHRNVQGLAFDDDGRLFASEFGQDTYDELNLITAGGNYGWPEVEGDGDDDGDYIDPLVTWSTDEASPSGLAYSHGSLWMAGLGGQRLWEIPTDGEEVEDPTAHFTDEYGRLRAVLATEDGILLGTSNTDGRGDPRSGDDRLMEVEL